VILWLLGFALTGIGLRMVVRQRQEIVGEGEQKPFDWHSPAPRLSGTPHKRMLSAGEVDDDVGNDGF
jgi:hypothetical protein